LFGSWAPVPQLPAGTPSAGSDAPTANVKLWLWSRSPFDFSRRTGAAWDEWFAKEYPAYPCIALPADQEICCGFGDLAVGARPSGPWHCPDHPELQIGWSAPPLPQVREVARDGKTVRTLCFAGGSSALIRLTSRAKSVSIRLGTGAVAE